MGSGERSRQPLMESGCGLLSEFSGPCLLREVQLPPGYAASTCILCSPLPMPGTLPGSLTNPLIWSLSSWLPAAPPSSLPSPSTGSWPLLPEALRLLLWHLCSSPPSFLPHLCPPPTHSWPQGARLPPVPPLSHLPSHSLGQVPRSSAARLIPCHQH